MSCSGCFNESLTLNIYIYIVYICTRKPSHVYYREVRTESRTQAFDLENVHTLIPQPSCSSWGSGWGSASSASGQRRGGRLWRHRLSKEKRYFFLHLPLSIKKLMQKILFTVSPDQICLVVWLIWGCSGLLGSANPLMAVKFTSETWHSPPKLITKEEENLGLF